MVNIVPFLHQTTPVLDVRSPMEFLQGHIPGAFSFPLLSDEERKIVGTAYKKEGKDPAVKLGLHFIGPKLLSFVEQAEKIVGPSKKVRLYCARGGMRSGAMAWLLQTAGFDCTLLSRGYKAFRGWVLPQFETKYSFLVLGGFTGSGKTDLLHLLQKQDKQIIDLEGIASHRGSSFGHLEKLTQPSCEHFENLLAMNLSKCDKNLPIWIEDESRMIGTCRLPNGFWEQMVQAPFLWIEKPKEERLKHILCNYGNYPLEELLLASKRLIKKLGAVKTQEIVQLIQNKELEKACSLILEYYDKTYAYSSQKNPRNRINFLHTESDLKLIENLISFSTQIPTN